MIFQARRAANRSGSSDPRDPRGYVGFGPKILCGFGQASMDNYCNETIAWVAQGHPGLVIIRDGLTDVGTPGTYRVATHTFRKAARRGDDPPGQLRMVAPPVVLPCPHDPPHLSRVEESVLARRQPPTHSDRMPETS